MSRSARYRIFHDINFREFGQNMREVRKCFYPQKFLRPKYYNSLTLKKEKKLQDDL